MSFAFQKVSIIIPVAPGETAHERLLGDLKNLDAEIIISSEGSRARSLNEGAAKASRTFLWFLHADSRVSADNIMALKQALSMRPNVLHYFDLAYQESGLPALNACGANMRSRVFDMPYGDQGFCISKTLFNKIDGYPENVSYGEDLLFVRLAKKTGIKNQAEPHSIKTHDKRPEISATRLGETHGFAAMADGETDEAADMSTAIAIFVKTPALSPVKTRLAAGIGDEAAREFYALSLQAIKETVKGIEANAYWAVAEEKGLTDPLWRGFPALHTGEGNLGERQHYIYETLLAHHDRVLLIGADAPQISGDISPRSK